MKRNKLVAIVAVVVVSVVAIFAIRLLSNEPFTTDKWTNATPEMRDRLMDSIARSGDLIGLSEAEVTAMLGDPDGSFLHGDIYYCGRYYENGKLKKRYGGMSRCLYIDFRDGGVDKAEFRGS